MTRAEKLRQPAAEKILVALQDLTVLSPPTNEELDSVLLLLADERKVIQRRAAEALARTAAAAPGLGDRLRALSTEGSLRQRWGAVFALSLLGPLSAPVLSTLLDALGSDDGDVRWAAADLLKQMAQRDSTAVTSALLSLARDGDPNQRKMALYCLRDLQCGEGLAVALSGLRAEAIEVQLAALSALIALATDRADAATQVLPLIDEGDERMRRAAAAALGQLAVVNDAVIATLERATQTEDAGLRRAASRALQAIAATKR